MSANFKYITYVFLVALLLISCKQRKPLPSLNETYNYEDKKPFGGYVAFTYIQQLLENRFIDTNTKPFNEAWKEMKEYSTDTKYSLYILIAKNLILSEAEANALISYVNEGNDLFVSADYIDDDLLQKIDIELERRHEIDAEVEGSLNTSSLSIIANGADSLYEYYYYPFFNSFNNFDSSVTKILGKSQDGGPNYIATFIGKGRLYLHTAPRAFSNYFLLTEDNSSYLRNALSYLRPQPTNIFWDDYYAWHSTATNTGNDESSRKNRDFSTLSVIKKYPQLWYGFLLSVALLLLFVLFNTRRKQRVINVIKPVENTTVQFAESIANLYLQKKDNKNIAEKMITYFYGYLRNKYFLTSEPGTTEFQTVLSKKSGQTVKETGRLLSIIQQINSAELVTDQELLHLNKQIELFTNTSP